MRFVSILFLIFKKGDQEIRISKYAFLIFEKGTSTKIASGFLRFVSMLF